ncbi:MAG: site-specific integrase [Actinomycetota bacterium]|nr:site-specific integrase [Actinomycetota bacterium]
MRGNIRRRAKDSWTIQVYLGKDPATGKKRYASRTVRGSKRDAERALANLIRAQETGLDLAAAKLTVAAYLDRWLDVSKQRVKPRTHFRYAQLVRLHVKPALGTAQLTKLRPLHIEELYGALRERGLSGTTVLQIHRVLHAALAQAVRWQLLDRNPADAVTAPRKAAREAASLSAKEIPKLLEEVQGTSVELPTLIALGTGMRLGEVLGLRRQDVDLDAATARVRQTLQITMEFDTPKSHRSSRTLSMPVFLVETLRRQRKAQNERRLMLGECWHELDLICDRGDGLPLRPDTVSKQFRTIAKAAGLPISFHGLRHTHASLMLAAGTDLKVTSARLGHSSISITADLYTHVASEQDRKAADALDAHVGRFFGA